MTNPKIQNYRSVLKERVSDLGSKGFIDSDDINDAEFEEINGQRLYALPRKKYLSEFLFNTIN